MKPTLARRFANVTLAFVSWAATAFAVLWFYDWVSRWYVVVAVLLAVVGAGMLGEKARAGKAEAQPRPALSAVHEKLGTVHEKLSAVQEKLSAVQENLPRQRDGEQAASEAADVSGRSAEVALLRPPA